MTMTIEAIFFKIRNLLLEWSGQLISLGLTNRGQNRIFFDIGVYFVLLPVSTGFLIPGFLVFSAVGNLVSGMEEKPERESINTKMETCSMTFCHF